MQRRSSDNISFPSMLRRYVAAASGAYMASLRCGGDLVLRRHWAHVATTSCCGDVPLMRRHPALQVATSFAERPVDTVAIQHSALVLASRRYCGGIRVYCGILIISWHPCTMVASEVYCGVLVLLRCPEHNPSLAYVMAFRTYSGVPTVPWRPYVTAALGISGVVPVVLRHPEYMASFR
ncbi:18142_t:CDS:2 [Acaulospora morrowiae]|uniref:18142_t:CDS:1 n=1 Tax=Acaulospora morrowiae TaxID=94023 RepID=A0A9N9DA66_9GLOM|nr:18142_t:CDS:2 [Acaulospora morrowiae]